MIKNPFLIIFVLLGIESLVLWLNSQPAFKKFFRFIPYVFWIYFLPMLAATAGLIDTKSPVFSLITTHLLPACLFLLLLPVDIRAILRLGKTALIMMASGSIGIILGTVVAFGLFKNIVGQEFYSGFGALSASWTGGSANMIAVKAAIAVPDKVFLPMVIVDTIVPYVWMGILVAMAGWQDRFDKWLGAKKETLTELIELCTSNINKSQETKRSLACLLAQASKASKKIDLPLNIDPEKVNKGRMISLAPGNSQRLKLFPAAVLGLLALGVSQAAQFLGRHCPEITGVISAYTWTIIIISFLGIGASFTKVRKLDNIGATKLGYLILYFVLTSIGAKASLTQLGATLPLILAGFVILGIHAVVIILTARVIRAPLFLAATASQANVGGVASGPIIAEIYQPGFAPVGLLLAIFGNIVGTYIGILTAQLCRIL